jgi:HAD superfamily hydrolase (TIGR01490 family)
MGYAGRPTPGAVVRIAFFDLDLTVFSVNSASLWMKRERRLGHLKRRQLARGVAWLGAYQLGFARMAGLIHDAVATLKGTEEAAIAARTAAFWEEEVRPTIRPGARAALERHRDQGDVVAFLTGSSPYLSRLAAAELGVEHILCTSFAVADGRFTGEAVSPLCYGPGKVDHARRLATHLGGALRDAFFYTDSYSDLPGLLAVGTPVAVHPDPRLRRHARKAGWTIEDWDAPAQRPLR